MKILLVIFSVSLFCAKTVAMHSNDCGTLKKELHKGVEAYIRTTDLGKRIYVQRQEKDGIECFAGYEGDIFGRVPMTKLPNDTSTAKLWYELHNDFQELNKINDIKE